MKANNWITVNNTNGEPTEMLLTAKGKYEKIKLPRLREGTITTRMWKKLAEKGWDHPLRPRYKWCVV
jgi:hypothetical protein